MENEKTLGSSSIFVFSLKFGLMGGENFGKASK